MESQCASSNQSVWLLRLVNRFLAEADGYPTQQAVHDAMRMHYAGDFAQIAAMLPRGLVIERRESLGIAQVTGSEAACQELKALVEAQGLATMQKRPVTQGYALLPA